MSEFEDWRAELAGARREGQRWIPGRRKAAALPLLLTALSVALAGVAAFILTGAAHP